MSTLTAIIQYSSASPLAEAIAHFNEKHADAFSAVHVFYVTDVEDDRVAENELANALTSANLVLVDVRSNRKAARILHTHLAPRNDVTVCVVMGSGLEILSLTRLGSFRIPRNTNARTDASPLPDVGNARLRREQEERSWLTGARYHGIRDIIRVLGSVIPFGYTKRMKEVVDYMRLWESEKTENILVILETLARKYLSCAIPRRKRQKEQKAHPAAFWHPNRGDAPVPLRQYLARHKPAPAKKTLLILFYGGNHFHTSVAPVRDIFERYGDEWNVIAFYTDGVRTLDYLRKHIGDTPPIDAVLSLLWFPMDGGPLGGDGNKTKTLLTSWNVPLFHGVGLYNMMYDDFMNAREGLSSIQVLAALVFPEGDGATDTLPLVANDEQDVTFGGTTHTLPVPRVIHENVDLMIRRIRKRIALREKPNCKKRLALVLFNYPPGEANVGNAAYFDGFASLSETLTALARDGYDTGGTPPSGKALAKRFREEGVVNSPRWTSEGAQRHVTLPLAEYSAWYETLPSALREDVERVWGAPTDDIRIPSLCLGNMLILLQPDRGDTTNDAALYHDAALPPTHAYLATYYTLRAREHVDAIIHFGTHGTLEFLPGKEAGMTSATCFNYWMVSDVPHFYLYQLANTAEGMIARRRSLATLLSYQPPPFMPSALHETFSSLTEAIAAYREGETLSYADLVGLKDAIITEAEALGITKDDVHAIEHEVVYMHRALIPKGLHIFGTGYNADDAARAIWEMQPLFRTEPTLFTLIGNAEGIASDAHDDFARYLRAHDHLSAYAGITNRALTLITRLLQGAQPRALANETGYTFIASGRHRALVSEIRAVGNALMRPDETRMLLHALGGGYVPSAIGGDPFRTPDVLPSGRNISQFNPQRVPTPLAMRRGALAAEQTIALYRASHNGAYPTNIAVVLWGFETAKTYGETVGEIFHLMGVRLAKNALWKRVPELIPLKELNRPRVNVTVNICGFMRDLFSHVLEIIDDAVDLACDADEPLAMNAVRREYLHLREQNNIADAERDADFMGRVRIFGPDAGLYGTNIPQMIEAKSWDDAEALGRSYAKQMRFAYRKNTRAHACDALFQEHLARVDMIQQVRDSKAYAITDLDHYYEFTGGLAQAARAAGNTLPPVYITDTSEVYVETTDLATEVSRGTVTRTANTAWVREMLRHPTVGGRTVAERVRNLLGFAATTESVTDAVWRVAYETIVRNEDVQNALRENNAHAYYETVETFLESIHRGYWDAHDDEKAHLTELYLQEEARLE